MKKEQERGWGGWLAALLLVLCCLGTSSAHAVPHLWGGETATGMAIVDETGTWSVDEASARFARGMGQPYDPDFFYPLEGTAVVWLQLVVPQPEVVMAVPHPGINRLDVFEPDGQGRWSVEHSGDWLPVSSWALPNLYPAFVVDRPPGPDGAILLRVSHNHPVSLQVRVWSKAEFDSTSQLMLLLLGSYLGFVFLVMCVNVFNWVAWNDRLHLTSAAYVFSIGMTQISLTGLGGLLLWPNSPVWNDYSAVILPLLGVVMAGWFTYRVVQNRVGVAWRSVLLTYCAAGLALVLAFALLERTPVYRVANLYFLLCAPVCLVAMVTYAVRNPRVGWWFVTGFAMLFSGGIFAVLRNLELLPMSPVTQFGAQIGAGLQVPFLLVGLYFRSREKRDNQMRMNTLARVDPLTGLASHRVMLDRLEQQLQRNGDVAVLRVRVGNAGALRDDYGQDVLDAALVHAGACIGRVARENDTVARHRDGDFMLMLGNNPSREQVAEVAQRIIARGLAHSPDLPERQTLKLLVAAAVPPLQWNDGAELVATLGDLVEEIQARGGKALRYLE